MTNTNCHFGGRLRPRQNGTPDWDRLVDLACDKTAFIYQRLSTHEQVRKHIYSIKAQDALEDLAQEDGYPDHLIYVGRRDLGISGTKGLEDRPELAYLIEQVERGLVEAVYVVHISRLYRDQTLINALALGELFKEHGVIVVTPQMRLNLRDRMHMRLYRMEVERAADELEIMANRLLGARDIKAKSGLYSGEIMPPGYVVDEREKLENGQRNPEYHVYQIYKPHADVVQVIFEQLSIPGMTAIQVARYCRKQNISFEPFAPEVDTPANRKNFIRSARGSDGNWPVTRDRVRSVATNPVYIGWRIWAGEVIKKDAFPPIVGEARFWAVQSKFGSSGPKEEHPPLPLGGLLYCGNHEFHRQMSYANDGKNTLYRCYDPDDGGGCVNITARILDTPIAEAVIGQLSLADYAGDVLDKLTDEYEEAKARSASYRREAKRLESEIANLRENLVTAALSPEQLQWLDSEIQKRLARIRELADLESQPIGAAVGPPVPGEEDIELVKEFLANLDRTWESTPNDLKNAFLCLLLDRVTIWPNKKTIRAKLVWRVGIEQEILIHRPFVDKRRRWTEDELAILAEHYITASPSELLDLLPGRTWQAIKEAGRHKLGLTRESHTGGQGARSTGEPYTSEEDELVRRYYAGEIGQAEVKSTGRTLSSIKARAWKLGLTWRPRKVTWEWLNESGIRQSGDSPGTSPPGCRSHGGIRLPGA
jgi:DNA invertase Pin-like site-specific DNA recombinase